jgi:DMSO/TMAO reductase YedYZ molybdopterin-dependent catalytic subunit
VIINGNLAIIRRVLRGALAGFLAAAVALGVAELVAGITGPLSSPVVAVGGVAIDLTPIPLKDFAIAHFGSNDKNVLVLGIVVQLAVFALVIGALAVRWLAAGLAGLAVFGALGVSAVVTRPSADFADALPTLIGVGVAAVAMVCLVRAATIRHRAGDEPSGDLRARAGRRRFLALSAGAAVVAVTAGGAGEVLLRRFNVAALRAAVRLPAPTVKAPAVPAGTALKIGGITPFYTSDSSFYRVDTDLVVPQVSPQDWTLRITGMVDHPIELSFADLLRLPLIEHDMTLVCVSNQVGGPYAGNARWLGASLPVLLRKAGIQRGADQVLSSGTDGMTISTAVDTIMDGRQALIAVGMNGQALPTEHGFPARMLVPGLYGYVSATKWVTELEVTTFAASRPTGPSAATPGRR